MAKKLLESQGLAWPIPMKAVIILINSFTSSFGQRLARRPNAWAPIQGGQGFSRLVGTLRFYQTTAGVLVAAELWGLPQMESNPGGGFWFQIEGSKPPAQPPAQSSGSKGPKPPQSKGRAPQPEMGLPVVYGNHGYGWASALTTRFTIREVLGAAVALFPGEPGAEGEAVASGTIK